MGRHKNIESPEKMWQIFTDYREHIKNNPIRKQVFVGKDGHVEYEERERPLTMEGFENYCADKDYIQDLGDYFSNRNNDYSNYSAICSRVKRTIKQCQIEGGMAGIYNPSITQRLNGLAEKNDNRLVDAEGNDRSFEITLNIK
jgi:hypothetical protein